MGTTFSLLCMIVHCTYLCMALDWVFFLFLFFFGINPGFWGCAYCTLPSLRFQPNPTPAPTQTLGPRERREACPQKPVLILSLFVVGVVECMLLLKLLNVIVDSVEGCCWFCWMLLLVMVLNVLLIVVLVAQQLATRSIQIQKVMFLTPTYAFGTRYCIYCMSCSCKVQ